MDRRRIGPTGLVIGRFQPFHKGHAALLDVALAAGPVVVGVGSSQESRTSRNPFTYGERKEMIQSVADVPVVAVPDINDPPNWVAHVQSLIQFDVVFGNDDATLQLFRDAGIEVVTPGLQHREKWEGTKIRQWENFDEVPAPVVPIIKRILPDLQEP